MSADVTEDELEQATADLVGITVLPVPIYAAVKQGGEPLYKKARRGEAVVPPMREMEVFATKLLDHYMREYHCVVVIECDVAHGVYVRSLAREFGRRLGYPARLDGLRRTHIGPYSVADARSVGVARRRKL